MEPSIRVHRCVGPRTTWALCVLVPALAAAQGQPPAQELHATAAPLSRGLVVSRATLREQIAGASRQPRPDASLPVQPEAAVVPFRIVEMPRTDDPFGRRDGPGPRALEVSAERTTMFVQSLGMPVAGCINRWRLPSRVSAEGTVSFKLQWYVGCRF